MKSTKQRNLIICILISLVLLFGIILLIPKIETANAGTIDSNDKLNFTRITSEDGETSYKVAVKPAYRSKVEFVVVPETYEGLAVTEVAANGFVSCANLTKVILPETVRTLGINAFMNCTKLKFVSMPCVESIGTNAFGMCTTLDRLFIPETVMEVGSNILRNNANTVYIQSSVEVVDIMWSSTWSDYFTGEIMYSVDPQDTIQYREVLATDNQTVIGYEIKEEQYLSDIDSDIVIYNSVCVDEELGYLPVLNICPEAFLFSQVNSITIRDRHADYPEAPSFNHKINIRSNAFLFAIAEQINIEVGVTFNHPENLQMDNPVSGFDLEPIVGDADGFSTRVFEEAYIKSITLPAGMDLITERMFYNCTYLESIKIHGCEYDGTNVLPDVNGIGAEAFSSCVALKNITVPESVNYVGEAAFSDLGVNVDEQIIYVDIYEDEIPEGWDSNWAVNNQNNVKINYKPLTYITVDLLNGQELKIGIKPGRIVPDNESTISRNGYIFNGIYSGEEEGGFQYYNSQYQGARAWNDGDPETLYVNWKLEKYNIIYNGNFKGQLNPNPTEYTIEDEIIFGKLSKEGYNFNWMPAGIIEGTTGDLTVTANWSLVQYKITYDVDLKGNYNSNPTTYTVEDKIVFAKLSAVGYTFKWHPGAISKGTVGDLTVTGTWEVIEYTITYDVDLYDLVNPNPTTYTVEDEITFANLARDGFIFSWNPKKIEKGTTGNLTVVGNWESKDYDIDYDVDWKGLENPNPSTYDAGKEITLIKLEYPGYDFYWGIEKIESWMTGDLTIKGFWKPIEYSITYANVWEGTENINPTKYDVEHHVIFAPATYYGYEVTWDMKGTEGYFEDLTVTASYRKTDILIDCYDRTTGIYEITTPFQLGDLLYLDTTKDKTFHVNVDYGGRVWNPLWRFYGTLYGEVRNIKLVPDYNVYAYGFILENYGTIKDFTLDCTLEVKNAFNGPYRRIGTICGSNYGTMISCTVKSSNPLTYTMHDGVQISVGILNTVDRYARIGGVVGYGDVVNCVNKSNIYSIGNIGGIAAESSSKILNCTNMGNIYFFNTYDEEYYIGGIVASSDEGIIGCINQGNINYINVNVQNPRFSPRIGGIVGYLDVTYTGYVYDCTNEGTINTGTLTDTRYVGDLIGEDWSDPYH